MTSQPTTRAMEAIDAMTRRHHDNDPANSHTVELIVAMAPVVIAATSAVLSPGTSSHGRLASTMPRSSRQRPLSRGSGTRWWLSEEGSARPLTTLRSDSPM